MKTLAIAVAVFVVLLAAPAAADDREPAAPLDGTNGYVCWNAHGYPLPQPEPTCPPCWSGAPPPNPLPLGTADPCQHGVVGTVTYSAPPAPPVAVVASPGFTG